MNVLQNLTELYNSQDIDSVYRDLALKILGNLDQMRRVTIYDIADLTNSSRTTIWRLVQKLGYESFSDFRYALQSAASQYVYYNRMIEQRKTASGAALLNGLSRQLSDTNKLLSQSVTAEEIDELTDEIANASKVHFYLPFRTSFVYSFQQNLWIDGKNSEYQCLLPQMLSSTRYLDDRSIVLISTIEYAETLDMTRVFETIKEKGSTIRNFALSLKMRRLITAMKMVPEFTTGTSGMSIFPGELNGSWVQTKEAERMPLICHLSINLLRYRSLSARIKISKAMSHTAAGAFDTRSCRSA